MAVHTITKGLDLPINGAPEQKIVDAPAATHVAIVAADYPGMKPRMHIKVGDEVKRGQLLFEDRKSEGSGHDDSIPRCRFLPWASLRRSLGLRAGLADDRASP